jgi:23S rRNA (uracil1939-C5)-methyltransferase
MSSTDPPVAGATLDLRVEKAVYGGLGFAHHEGQVVFIPKALPGERIRARVESQSRGYLRASLEEVLEPSVERRASPCSHAGRCGGCSYQELAYAGQLRLKARVVAECLARAGVAWDREIESLGSPEAGWRTRAAMHLSAQSGTVRAGFLEAESHTFVDIEHCLHLSEAMNAAAHHLAEAVAQHGLGRHVERLALAESDDGARLVAVFEGRLGSRQVAPLRALAADAMALEGNITGLGAELAVGRGRARFERLAGDPYVAASVGGLTYRAHVRSFFQGNRFLLGPLVEAVVAELPEAASVLDLYSGVGLFALAAAQAGAHDVTGVEVAGQASRDARANAKSAGLRQVEFRCGEAREGALRWRPKGRGVVIVDPPRTGLGKGVADAVMGHEPDRIIYVSCDPPTLGRDLARVIGGGYTLCSLRVLDMFPGTSHVETIAVLQST